MPILTEGGVDIVEVDTVYLGQPPVETLVSQVGVVLVVEVSLNHYQLSRKRLLGSWTCLSLKLLELKMSDQARVWAPIMAVTSLSVKPNSKEK